jgi:hypothetical protein
VRSRRLPCLRVLCARSCRCFGGVGNQMNFTATTASSIWISFDSRGKKLVGYPFPPDRQQVGRG